MRTAIMTDSNGAISLEEGKRLGIYILPMPISIEGETFKEEVDIDAAKLFEAISEKKNVLTSQPSPGELMDMWEKIFADGYDEIVHIPMSSGLSGSCLMAKQFAERFDGRVHVVDSTRVSVTQRCAVFDALTMALSGMRAEDICKKLVENDGNARIYIALDTIECLKRGGRISHASAAIAAILGIKPIISIINGVLGVKEKMRGTKKAKKYLLELAHTELKNAFSAFPQEDIVIVAAGSFTDSVLEEAWKTEVGEAFPQFKVEYRPLSCSLSSHIGPDGFGIGIVASEFAKEYKKI